MQNDAIPYKVRLYKIVSTINDDFYVGSTRNELRTRLSQHRKDMKKSPNRNGLYQMMNEYSSNCFRIIIIKEIEVTNRQEQLQEEQNMIDELKPKLNKMNAQGLNICEHGKRRTICTVCGGGATCKHGRVRCICKDCDGGGICDHNKRRSRCIDCGGGGICDHNKRRSRCIDCGGSQILPVYCYDCDTEMRKDYILRHIRSQKHLQNVLPINVD